MLAVSGGGSGDLWNSETRTVLTKEAQKCTHTHTPFAHTNETLCTNCRGVAVDPNPGNTVMPEGTR